MLACRSIWSQVQELGNPPAEEVQEHHAGHHGRRALTLSLYPMLSRLDRGTLFHRCSCHYRLWDCSQYTMLI
jgi:hypothetical protein